MSLRTFDGPFAALVKREVIANLRTVRSFLLLCLAVGGLIVVVSLQMKGAAAMGGGAFLSRFLFHGFTTTLSATCLLCVAPLGAVSICVERQKETYEHLALTALRSGQIVLGKAIGAFFFYLCILVAVLPVAGVMFFLVGIDWREFSQSVGRTSLLALLCAMVGVACSTRFTNARTAAGISVAFVVIFSQLIGGIAIAITLVPGSVRTTAFAISATAYALGALAAFSYARRGVTRAAKENRLFAFLEQPVDYGSAVFRKSPPFLGPKRASLSFSRGRARSGCALFLLLVCVHIFGVIGYMASEMVRPNVDRLWPGTEAWLVAEALVLILLTPSALATQVAREYEQNTMDLLRMTLLSPEGIVLGKLSQAALSMLPFLAGVLVSCVVMVLRMPTWRLREYLIFEHLFMLSFVLFVACAVLLASMFARRTSVGLMLGYGACLGVLLVTAYIFAKATEISSTLTRWMIAFGCGYLLGSVMLVYLAIGVYEAWHHRAGVYQ